MESWEHWFSLTFTHAALLALVQVILIDITLAGDNAVIIGMVASNVEPGKRRRVVFYGLAFAVLVLSSLALLVSKLLTVIGLTFAGGILLLWVAYRFYRDIKDAKQEKEALASFDEKKAEAAGDHPGANAQATKKYTSIGRAVVRIAIADLSMSLDNVLAVAGTQKAQAPDSPWVLFVGLALSIALTGVAALYIARLLQKFPWISYAGLLMIVYVAVRMIIDGGGDVWHHMIQ